jgi:hypothetical protein
MDVVKKRGPFLIILVIGCLTILLCMTFVIVNPPPENSPIPIVKNVDGVDFVLTPQVLSPKARFYALIQALACGCKVLRRDRFPNQRCRIDSLQIHLDRSGNRSGIGTDEFSGTGVTIQRSPRRKPTGPGWSRIRPVSRK